MNHNSRNVLDLLAVLMVVLMVVRCMQSDFIFMIDLRVYLS